MQARDQVGHRRLPRARRTDESGKLTGLDRERDALEGRRIVCRSIRIAKDHIFELDAAELMRDLGDGRGIRLIGNGRGQVEVFENAGKEGG